MNNWLITGGAGFIGSNFIRHLIENDKTAFIVNLDLLTYAGSILNFDDFAQNKRHKFIKGNILDEKIVEQILIEYKIDTIVNFAAESHVDRSIAGPRSFIETNINGTFNLLETARKIWATRSYNKFRFLHVSTDEVYGSLGPDDPPFCEDDNYKPNSPYAASKASSDHLVNAYYTTYGFPSVITNCSNNYGPYQYPEKLVPLIIVNALTEKSIPIYGDGRQVRDWIYVKDHCRAILLVLNNWTSGKTYNIGGNNEKYNIDVVREICKYLDKIKKRKKEDSYLNLITYVKDRPGHDRRYAINNKRIESQLGWTPKESFETGIRKTIDWYLAKEDWVNSIMTENYNEWIALNYNKRLKTAK